VNNVDEREYWRENREARSVFWGGFFWFKSGSASLKKKGFFWFKSGSVSLKKNCFNG
jgi:hypothetical protein